MRRGRRADWTSAIVAGLGGSPLGGQVVCSASGDGLALWPCGIIGSLAGATVLTSGCDEGSAGTSRPRRNGRPCGRETLAKANPRNN